MRKVVLATMVFLAAGCGRKAESASEAAAGEAIPREVLALSSAEVKTDLVEEGVVRLKDGEYMAPAAPGSAEQIIVRLFDKWAMGDVNGDGKPETAAIIGSSSGGTGVFISLVAFAADDGTPRELASALLGDRVRVIAVSIDKGLIRVELDQHGEVDPMCCPAQRAVREFRMEGDSLTMVSATPPPFITP
jgi:hypothetical protein